MSATKYDGKMLVNAVYHGALVTTLAVSYALLAKKVGGAAYPKLDYNLRDVGMITLDVTLATLTKDTLIKQGIIPDDIMK